MKTTAQTIILLTLSILLAGCFFDTFNYESISPQKVFQNRNFTWVSDSSKHIRYYFAPNSVVAKNIDSIKVKSERYMARVLSLIHENDYSSQLDLIFTDSQLKMKELTSVPSNGLANWKYNAIYYVYGDSLKVLGAHEFNHVIVKNMWGETTSYLWLAEGFAGYSDDAWGNYDLHVLCKFLLDNNYLLPISVLQSNFDNYSSMITYPESGSFVKFLYEHYGFQKLKSLWQQGDGRVESIYGKSFKELEAEWISLLRNYNAQDIKYKI
jgi:hypothetical protein